MILRKTILRNAILSNAISDRRAEIRLYDVNIFNFRHVAAQIGEGQRYTELKADMLRRIGEEQHQKGVAAMVLEALTEQRRAVPWWRRWLA